MSAQVARTGGRIAVPLGVAAAIVGLAVAPVFAAGNPTVSRGNGTDATAGDTTSDTCFHVVGDVPSSFTNRGASTTLAIVDPAGTTHNAGSLKVSATSDQRLSFQFATAGLSWSNNCGTGSQQAVNGNYQAKLTGGTNASTTFRVEIPPAAPSGFVASASGTVGSFSWQPNTEPDLAGYDIVEGAGNDVTPGGVDPASVCDSHGCSVSIDFGSSAQGTTHTFQVEAMRHTSPGSSSTVNAASASQTVSFPAAPTPSGPPSGGGSGAGSTGGGSSGGVSNGGGSTGHSTGGRTVHQGGQRLSGRHPAADLTASLPTVSAGGAPDLPSVLTEVKPLPEGTYKPLLPYRDQVTREAVGQRSAPRVTAGVVHEISAVLDMGPLWRALAGAAVLMLVAVHLRVLVERVDTD